MLPPISQRIVEFAGDDLPKPDDVKEYLGVLQFAQMAWNYSILPPDSDAVKTIYESLLRMPPDVRTAVHSRLLEWSERKKKMFPTDRRIIFELKVKDSKRRLTVEAASYDYENPKTKPA